MLVGVPTTARPPANMRSSLLIAVVLNLLSLANRAQCQSISDGGAGSSSRDQISQAAPLLMSRNQAASEAANDGPAPPLLATSERQSAVQETSSSGAEPFAAASIERKLLANSQDTNALLYLQKYGYMQSHSKNSEANNLISEESFSEAVASFQRFAGIPETGTIDNQTLRLMRTPRCGNVDKSGELRSLNLRAGWLSGGGGGASSSASAASSLQQTPLRKRRKKRYALQGSKWRRQELTYRISQYPTRFNGKRHEVDAQIERAFGIWSQVAPINFVVKREGRVHIDIRFASGDHGDGDAFDGPGNTLAHAYFPQYGGDAHFDDQEYWTIDSYAGTNIFQVAAHELGHSLGLGHSNVREALMAPFYQKYKPNFKLHVDDILAIQALYGEKSFLAGEIPSHPPPPLSIDGASPSSSSSSSSSSSNDIGSAYDSGHNHHHHPHHHHHHHHHRGHPAYQPPATPSATTSTAPTAAAAAPSSTSTTTTSTSTTTSTTSTPPTSGPRFMFGLSPVDTRFPFRPPPPPVNRHGFGGHGREATTAEPDHEGDESNGIDTTVGHQPAGASPPFEGPPPAPPVATGALPADLCTDPTIDAVTRTEDGRSYVFKGDFYWLLTSDGLARDYPRKISLDWEGLPGSLDAALTWADGKTFFFKGNKYWRFRNRRRDIGYPKLISAGFAGIPDDIDAAFVWSGNGRTYIFKGTEYWRFDSKADPPVSSEYPRSIRVWNGVPSHINAAFRWENNVTYFFKGNQYYRFNDKDFKVEARGKPPFPRPSAEWWFGCTNTNLAQKALPGGSGGGGGGGLRADNGMTVVDGATPIQDTDWSYLAGLEDNTRLMGTHISDHKPPSTATGNSDTNTHPEGSEMPRSSPRTSPKPTFPQTLGSRIGLFNPTGVYSSSAISNFGTNICIQVLVPVLISAWFFDRVHNNRNLILIWPRL